MPQVEEATPSGSTPGRLQTAERVPMSHILIVEDETIIRSALRRLLERNQYEVSEAGSV